ncbi:hypothetical protein GGH95_005712, partial [Coemansia sp. RSA 1836]
RACGELGVLGLARADGPRNWPLLPREPADLPQLQRGAWRDAARHGVYYRAYSVPGRGYGHPVARRLDHHNHRWRPLGSVRAHGAHHRSGRGGADGI